MRKTLIAFSLAVIALSGLIAEESSKTLNAGHYEIAYPEGFSGAEGLADALNGLWSSFNARFGFDPDTARHRLKVTVLSNRAAFDAYVRERIGETRSQYIFLRYPKTELSELVVFPAESRTGSDAFSGPALSRQAFLQYLYSFVQEPPLWVRDGFQAHYERAIWDPASRTVSIAPYSPWLEAAKNLRSDPARIIGSKTLLEATTGSNDSAAFYPQAWAYTEFFVTSDNPDYQRFLHETFMLLEGDSGFNAKSQKDNTDAVLARFARFNDFARADADFTAWLEGQHTFNELVQAGVSLYNGGKFPDARKSLVAAAGIRSDDPIVLYYLGLISYSEREYSAADAWYRKALDSGAEVSTVNWALGLNAYADKRYMDAKRFIEAARQSNPARYGDKGEKLINSMPK